SDIGNVVKFAQMLHDDLADCFRGNLALALALQLADDFRNHLLDPLRLDRTLAQRNLYGAHQLVAIERDAPAGTLDDGQFAQLHTNARRQTATAGEPDNAMTDDSRTLHPPQIIHLRIETSATRATHNAPNFSVLINGNPCKQCLDLGAHRGFD